MASCLNNSAVRGCYNGAQVVLHYTYDNSGQPQVRITDLNGAVVAGATSANTVIGDCAPGNMSLDASGLNIAAGTFAATYDPAGNGSVWNPPIGYRLQSFAVTALEGSGLPGGTDHVRILNTLTGQARHLLKGESVSWSVAQEVGSNEFIDPGITVTCLGNSAAGIQWIGRIL